MDVEDTVITRGEYAGMTIRKIAETDDGLLWLDEIVWQRWFSADNRKEVDAIESYLARPTVEERLDRILVGRAVSGKDGNPPGLLHGDPGGGRPTEAT